MIKVSILGPESTGKTYLAKALAGEYKVPWVPEYSRNYLTHLGRPYKQEDLSQIARGQLTLEKGMSRMSPRVLFLDTDLHVIKIWSEYKYGNCDPWILQQMQMQHYDLHILTYHDISYEEDPLRENPDERPQLFDIYEQLMKDRGLHYRIVKGDHQQRMEDAKRYINALL